MTPYSLAALVHILGFVTGAALYAMLLALALPKPGGYVSDRLALFTGALGLIWNVIGLITLGRQNVPLEAIAYAALGFLPAVVVHSVLGRERRWMIAISYAVSAAAAVMMFWSPHSALWFLSWSFAAIALPVFFMSRFKRAWWIFALAVFAVSALHLAAAEHANDSWWVQLIGHHASLALIFAILYEDYRFAFADLFLKRGLTLFFLVVAIVGIFVVIVEPIFASRGLVIDPVTAGALLVVWVITALLFPVLRRGVFWFVDRVVLDRADYPALKSAIGQSSAQIEDIDTLLTYACSQLAPALSAEEVTWREYPGPPAETLVPIPTAEPPSYALSIGKLTGGRRLLSDDVELLESVAVTLGRRIDTIRMHRISRLAAEAELRALRAQISPHFLFNALNTISYLVQTSPIVARTTLMKLTSLLRGVLRSGSNYNTLGEEAELASAYLDIEKARFEERLRIQMDIPEELRDVKLLPLLIQPLVENAVKHGISVSRTGGEIAVHAHQEANTVVLTVRNTGLTPSEVDIARGKRQGVGLRNIEERLRLHFQDRASLTIRVDAQSTVAEIRMPIDTVQVPMKKVARLA
ncbi:MAG TPA: histidine kinase [Thermoanaerobaculia bacterium]|nr:histidine kinase [Thermoanaerobaculia bacterium]